MFLFSKRFHYKSEEMFQLGLWNLKGLSFAAIARCPNGCGEELRLGDKADHCKNDCPKRQAGELALWHWAGGSYMAEATWLWKGTHGK